MKKLLISAMLTVALISSAAGAHTGHQPSAYCTDHQASTSQVKNPNLLIDAQGTRTTAACVNQGPVQGAVVVKGNGAGSNGGYVLVDGNSTNPGPALDGYVVLQIEDNTDKTGVIARCSGDYVHEDPDGASLNGQAPHVDVTNPTACS